MSTTEHGFLPRWRQLKKPPFGTQSGLRAQPTPPNETAGPRRQWKR